MGRFNQNLRHARVRKNAQNPLAIQSDGLDVEFSEELADHDDLKAERRAEEAEQRVKNKQY